MLEGNAVMLNDVQNKLSKGHSKEWLDFYMEANGYEEEERKDIWSRLK